MPDHRGARNMAGATHWDWERGANRTHSETDVASAHGGREFHNSRCGSISLNILSQSCIGTLIHVDSLDRLRDFFIALLGYPSVFALMKTNECLAVLYALESMLLFLQERSEFPIGTEDRQRQYIEPAGY